MVSKETSEFIEAHLEKCPECKAELSVFKEDDFTPVIKDEKVTDAQKGKPFKKIMKKMNLQMHSISYLLIIFFIFFGFLSMDNENVFYNSIIMPVVGVFGYIIFRFSAFYKLPVLLLVINFLASQFGWVDIEFSGVFFWTAIFTIFVFIGILIAGLIEFALRKEK
jgi:hypothetical protein